MVLNLELYIRLFHIMLSPIDGTMSYFFMFNAIVAVQLYAW